MTGVGSGGVCLHGFRLFNIFSFWFLSFQRYMEVSANLRDSYEDKDG